MTLIAFACDAQQACIVTDTMVYTTRAVTRIAHSTKVHPLPHIDSAMMSQGDGAFGLFAQATIGGDAQETADFDELVAVAPKSLAALWGHQLDEGEPDHRYPTTAFLVGYSPSAQRFRAYGFASEHGFVPFEIAGLWVMPAPWSNRPSDLELSRIRAEWADDPKAMALLDEWSQKPEAATPDSIEQWVMLALATRYERALSPFCRTLVGGGAMLTTITRGNATSTRMFDFDDDDPDEFERLVAGTLHPVGQRGPCPCGSGKRFLDCHLAERLDDPCWCGTGATVRNCCMVQRDQEAPAAALTV